LLGLTVFPDNHRAIRAYERVGFKKQCVLEKSWRMPDGGYVDMVLMEIILSRANTLE
jgi:RimJ/RimL family protein N-acetyltransferase